MLLQGVLSKLQLLFGLHFLHLLGLFLLQGYYSRLLCYDSLLGASDLVVNRVATQHPVKH